MPKLSRFYTTSDLSPQDLQDILACAALGKQHGWQSEASALCGKVVGLVFLNPSLRTRASFQAGIARLGGQSIVLSPGADMWSLELEPGMVMNGAKTEHIKDAGPVLSSYCDVLAVRCFPAMQNWREDSRDPVWHAFSEHVRKPLLSMESALWHPCQALADALTLHEVLGVGLQRKTLALTWAPHPKQLPMAVPNSTLLIAAQLGMNVRLVCPPGYELETAVLQKTQSYCELQGSRFDIFHDQGQGLGGVDVVYAKSWTPAGYVGKSDEEFRRRETLCSWELTAERYSQLGRPWFMHCLPVRRNVEVSDAVLDSDRSLILRQAENRLHAQNALLLYMLRD